jgi:hypothetical protein
LYGAFLESFVPHSSAVVLNALLYIHVARGLSTFTMASEKVASPLMDKNGVSSSKYKVPLLFHFNVILKNNERNR